MAKLNTSIDMTQGSPYRLFLRFMVPLLIGNIMQQLYNLVDTIVVGNVLGETALAAVGSGFPFMFLLVALFIGFGMGAMIVVSQLFGRKDHANLQKLLETIYRVLLIAAVPITVIGFFCAEPVLRLMQVHDPDTLHQATLYLRVVFLGLLGMLGFNLNAGFLQGIGDSLSSLLFLSIATVVNIILDLLFTMVLPLGVLGVAIATSIAQTVSWIYGIFYINYKYKEYRINLFKLRFDKTLLVRCAKLGLPASVQQLLYAIGNMIMQSVVNSNGKIFTAGFVTSNRVDTFVFLPILSMATAITTYVGQNVGCHDMRRVKGGIKSGLILMVSMSFAIGWLIWLLRVPALSLFNRKPEVIQTGLYYLDATLPFYSVLGLMYGLNAVFQGVGQTLVPMISASVSQCIARAIIILILVTAFGRTALYYAYPLSWVVGSGISLFYYKFGGWHDMVYNDTLTGKRASP